MLTRRFVVLAILIVLVLPAMGKNTAQGGKERVPLDVSLSSNCTSGSMGDSVVLTTTVKNVSDDALFVYGKLRWGPSSSLFLLVTDDSGKSVPMGYFEDALPPTPSAIDKTLFIKLNPEHFFGVSRSDKLSQLVPKPGVYYFQVVYHGPVPRRFAAGRPAWGTEDPPVLSNKIRIDVQ
jgi:hypothetical protein